MIDQYIKEKHINYYEFNEFNEFNNIEGINSGLVKVYRTNWKQIEKCITLKSFSLVNKISLWLGHDHMTDNFLLTNTDW